MNSSPTCKVSKKRLPSLTLALLNSAETNKRKEFGERITKVRSSFNKAKE